MKSISFILGFLILALALKPCADGYNAEHENDVEISMEHSHQNDHDDSCAMLCVCNCCGTLIVHQEPPTFALQSKIKISTQLNSHYESHYRFNILAAIWQPPQVSS
ncbi:DUF6660 family protein [Kordia jejudonensis]|uniref:DUF6660 family protein n=1 Tax=Kordia jejudonensis TaxID=1348245 RepID=UPI000629A3A1|nr:DUF6660 family protein [Kordia jejudonensis]